MDSESTAKLFKERPWRRRASSMNELLWILFSFSVWLLMFQKAEVAEGVP